MSDDTLTVDFRPRLGEMFYATLVLLVGVFGFAIGAAFMATKPMTSFSCDRASCRLHATSLFGGANDFSFEVSQLRDSSVESAHGETTWVVQAKGHRFELGNATDDAELAAIYERAARDFQAFLTDPGKPTFAVAFYPNAHEPTWLFFVIGALSLAWGIKWRRGWKAQLVFDRASHSVTIHQRPWARRRTLPLAEVAAIRASDRIAHTMYGNLRWEDIALLGRDGKPVWRYRTMFTRKTYEHVQSSVKAIESFLARAA